MILYHIKEFYYEFVIFNRDYIINILLDIRENSASRCLNGCTVCYCIDSRKCCHLAILKGYLHTICPGRFNTDYFDIRIKHLCQSGNTCCESASSNRNKNIIDCRKLLDYLHCNTSLSCCYIQIIEWVDKSISVFISKLKCIFACFIIHISVKHNICSIALGSVYFNNRS